MGHFRQQKLSIEDLLVLEMTEIGACILIESVSWCPENTNFTGKS